MQYTSTKTFNLYVDTWLAANHELLSHVIYVPGATKNIIENPLNCRIRFPVDVKFIIALWRSGPTHDVITNEYVKIVILQVKVIFQ